MFFCAIGDDEWITIQSIPRAREESWVAEMAERFPGVNYFVADLVPSDDPIQLLIKHASAVTDLATLEHFREQFLEKIKTGYPTLVLNGQDAEQLPIEWSESRDG